MVTLRRVLGVGALTVLLAACWPMPGAGPDRRSYNPYERALTAERVGDLTEVFRVPLPDGAGPPVVSPDGLFVRTGLSIAAFEPRTGTPRWSAHLPEFETFSDQVSDPFIVGGRGQVVATWDYYERSGFLGHAIVTMDVATGALVRSPTGGVMQSLRGTELAGIETEYPEFGRFTNISVSGLDGVRVWGGLAIVADGGVLSFGEGRLFLATGSQVQAYDTTTPCPPFEPGNPSPVCEPEWTSAIGSTATPVVIGDNETVYVGAALPGGLEGQVRALRAGSGGIRFRIVVDQAVTLAPALAGGTLFIATTDGRLSAAAADGCGAVVCRASWTTATGGEPSVQPAVAGGVVYLASADGTIRAFDADGCGQPTCPPLWTVDVGSPVTGGLAVYGGQLYVGTAAGIVGYGLPPA